MIRGRRIDENYCWRVFQHGHSGWWYTDGCGVVCRQPYAMREGAEEAMLVMMKILSEVPINEGQKADQAEPPDGGPQGSPEGCLRAFHQMARQAQRLFAGLISGLLSRT